MQNHTKVYMDYFGYGIDDFVPCELPECRMRAVDVHHINGRGKGKDVIENLMGLCRLHHRAAHGLEKTYLHKDVLSEIHINFMKNH